MQSLTGVNRRVLVVDDNRGIHADARKILAPRTVDQRELDLHEAKFFGGTLESPGPQLELEYELQCVESGETGVAAIEAALAEKTPFALAFVDMRMPPGINGVETTRRIWAIDPRVQIVLCTAFSDYTLADIVRELGTTDQLLILRKPFDPIEMALLAISQSEKWNTARHSERLIQMQNRAIDDSERVLNMIKTNRNRLKGRNQQLKDETSRLNQTVQQQAEALLETREVTCLALAQLAEARDSDTGEHIRRHQVYTQIVGRHLSESGRFQKEIDDQFLSDLWRCSPLHDVGKVGIADEILLKPGRLTEEEFEIMKTHSTLGAEVLKVICRDSSFGSYMTMAIDIARFHHEHFDGNGYPEGLKGEAIPLAARIVAVTDVFDALVSRRVYKDAISPAEAKEIIVSESGTHFDPAIVDAFCECFPSILTSRRKIESHMQRSAIPGYCKMSQTEFEELLCLNPEHSPPETHS